MGSKDFQWFVFEAGSTMSSASGTAQNRDFADREMMHYTMMYGEDGLVRYRMGCGGESNAPVGCTVCGLEWSAVERLQTQDAKGIGGWEDWAYCRPCEIDLFYPVVSVGQTGE